MNKIKYPQNIDEVKDFCQNLCKEHKVEIYFDDKFKNFYPEYNQCASSGDHIDCAKYSYWCYDLLLFAVLHELGHILGKSDKTKNKNGFCREYEAWNWAIEKHIELFNRNISAKQARYMMYCLNTYLPDYNSWKLDIKDKDMLTECEGSFWCPINQETIIS